MPGDERMTDVTLILSQIESGDPSAAEQLLPLVYDELRKLAAARMARKSPGHTLQATVLVHEAYLRLVQPNADRRWKDRRHFFIVAAEAMRQVLIENARRRKSARRGGGYSREDIDPAQLVSSLPSDQLMALNDALEELAVKDASKAELVKLRFFAGLTVAEAAETLGIPSRTAERQWAYTRAWLQCQLAERQS